MILTPGLNDIADLYELVTGYDFVTREKLTPEERTLSGLGVVAGSGKAYLWARRAMASPTRHAGRYSRELSKASGKSVTISTKDLKDIKEFLHSGKSTKL